MNTSSLHRRVLLTTPLLLGALLALGCEGETPSPTNQDKDKPAPAANQAEAKKVLIGRNIWLEVQGERRRILVAAEVCLKQGALEELLCRKQTKEHESILSADIDARQLHAALEAAGAKAGSSVRFEPKYRPANGTKVRVLLQYTDQGKQQTVPAQQWVRDANTKKDLAHDWVFGGSRLVPNRLDANEPPYYLANDGDVISVSNFESSLLDLPIESPKDNAGLVYEINSERVPDVGTAVTVILEPVREAKK